MSTPGDGVSHRRRFRDLFRRTAKEPPADAGLKDTLVHSEANVARPQTTPQATGLDEAQPSEEPHLNPDQSIQSRSDRSRTSKIVDTDAPEPATSTKSLTNEVDDEAGNGATDIWSAAYREAVKNFKGDIDPSILKGGSVTEVFKRLEELDHDAAQDSAFIRGVKYLHSLRVPLERFTIALDLASPLTSIDPTAGLVFGLVKSVTAIAISFSTASEEFAKSVEKMLQKLSFIDDCDALGAKREVKEIHKALVLVYGDLLEFLSVAFEILSRKGAKLIMKTVRENVGLKDIVDGFSEHAGVLPDLLQKETWKDTTKILETLYDQDISAWLDGAKLRLQSDYHVDNLQLLDAKACEFLLSDATFTTWYQSTACQQLVLLGDMGCGKTVAMAFLIEELCRRNEHQLPRPKVCYHYCKNGEGGQAVRILSNFILSLFDQLPGLKTSFHEWYKQVKTRTVDPARHTKTLEQWIQETLKTLDRPVFLVIDALDECDDISRNELLKILSSLSRTAPRLKVLLSSRHDEIWDQITDMVKLYLVPDAARDRIIVEKTVTDSLFWLSSEVQTLVIETLSKLAKGSAIWTKMTVALIAVRRISERRSMQAFLDDMPQPIELSKLYSQLLSEATQSEPDNLDHATSALKVLAIVRRPLSKRELTCAVALDLAPEGVQSVDSLILDIRRVMHLIRSFIAHVDEESEDRQIIRLAHQSVKDFVSAQLTPEQPDQRKASGSRMTKKDNALLFQARIMGLEASMLDICFNSLLLDNVGITTLLSESQEGFAELPQVVDIYDDTEAIEDGLRRFNPVERGFGELFVYASCYWVEHFGEVSAEYLLPDMAVIERLCQAGSIRLSNWLIQRFNPECVVMSGFEVDISTFDPLSITALYGSEAMLRTLLENSNFETENYLADTAMVAAQNILQEGDLQRLEQIFHSKVGHRIRNFDFVREMIIKWRDDMRFRQGNSKRWEVAFSLVEDMLGDMAREKWAHRVLFRSARHGCVPLMQRLMMAAQQMPELKEDLLEAWQPDYNYLEEAILNNHPDVVEILLAQPGVEDCLQYRNNTKGENMLHTASTICDPAMYKHLVPRLKQGVHETDAQGDTPLMRIVSSPCMEPRSRHESARNLISEGNIHENDRFVNEQEAALRMAVRRGDVQMCDILITMGKISPLSAVKRGEDGQWVLKDRSYEATEGTMAEILDLLLALAGPDALAGLNSSD